MPHCRELLADGRPVAPGDRAFDVLMELIEGPGTVISTRISPDDAATLIAISQLLQGAA